MFNCLILGSGRSGTSMVAGTLNGAGYFMGDRIMSPTRINPKGYFESKNVEAINEELLSQVVPARPRGIIGNFFKNRPTRNQRWLARIPLNKKVHCPLEIAEKIESLTQKQPFCFKDPRFCYTLPAWRPFLMDTVFLCIFRHPAATASSILKVRKKQKYLHNFSINFGQALQVWELMYQHILKIHIHKGKWLFIHYNQVLEGTEFDKIEEFIDGKIDRNFPDASLQNSDSFKPVSAKTYEVYEELCKLANYKE